MRRDPGDLESPAEVGTVEQQQRRRWWEGPAYVVRRLGHVGPLAVLTVALPIAGGMTLVVWRAEAGALLNSYEAAAPLVFIAIATVLGALSLLPTHGLSLVGGYVFGFTEGVVITLTAIVIASVLGYFVKRLISRQRVMGLIAERPGSLAVHEALVEGGFWWSALVVTLIRLSPAAPFAMTNLLMAATGVRLVPFTLGTLVGMLPRCAAVVATGDMIARIGAAEDAQQVWPLVLGIVTTIAAVIVIGAASRRALARVTAKSV
ncbi:MAG: VTT domain-containing protein [Phycisphaeraceae bacterium]